MKALGVALCLGAMAVAGCASNTASGDFRTGDRPDYDKPASIDDVGRILDSGGTVLDVRLREDYDANPVLIANARYRDPEMMADWVSEIRKSDGPVVVYCVRGKWVSQKVAHYLDAQGIEVYTLDGGIEAWQANGRPTANPE